MVERDKDQPQEMTPRSVRVLRSIIGQYIQRAMPVPSQSLVNDTDLGVSSATIRNEMALLERAGLIRRPHISAGSVPSFVAAQSSDPRSWSQWRKVDHGIRFSPSTKRKRGAP